MFIFQLIIKNNRSENHSRKQTNVQRKANGILVNIVGQDFTRLASRETKFYQSYGLHTATAVCQNLRTFAFMFCENL